MKTTLLKIKRNFGLAFVCAFALLSTFGAAQAQCTVSLNPSADTYVFSRTDQVNSNFGAQNSLPVGTWTWEGIGGGTVRSYLQFNLATIPANATITSATLILKAEVNAFLPGGHQMAGGASNAAVINPVTSAWGENTVTWNSKPTIGAASVAVPQSTTNNQGYAVNLLSMVQNMYADPAKNFGFSIKQNLEIKWGLLIFGSRENSNPTLRPTLVVTYLPPAPTWVTTPPANACIGSTIDYSVNPVPNAINYRWFIDGVIVNSSTSPSYSFTWPAPAGKHKIMVIASACGTTSEVSAEIRLFGPPTVTAITGNTTVCENQYTPLSNTNADGVWSSSLPAVASVNSFGLVQGVSAGAADITYTVTTPWGCATSVSTLVTVNGPPVFTIDGPSTLCPNTSGNAYSALPAGKQVVDFAWAIQNAPSVGIYFPDKPSSFVQLSIPSELSGSFILRCMGMNSCGALIVSKPISITTDVPPSPDVTCSGTSGSNTCVNLEVSNYGTNSIEWIVNGAVQSTAPTFTRPLGTPVLCTYTSASGCKQSFQYSPEVICTDAMRMAEEIELPVVDKPFVIYPNPSKGVFKIQTKNQEGTASIYDLTDQLVQEIPLSSMQNDYTVEIGTPGMYTIHIRTNNETKAYKIVIE